MSPIDRAATVSRWLRICEWLVFALLAAQFCTRTLPAAWTKLNTDFPNYYLTASLLHEHSDTSRVYEWLWIQRQKDHRQIDQRIVGMVPITPFSTLAVYPLTGMAPLVAKHWWTVFNGGLLLMTLFLLRKVTRIAWRHILLVTALSFSLRLNFLYGQYYVLLLFLLALACYLYLRGQRVLSGAVIGIAAGLKIFPVIFLLYFLRKRDLKAFLGGAASGTAAAILSVAAFGWHLHQTYLSQVMPAALRGEGLDPYNLYAASLSSLLHRLFVYEPQLNPHPAIHAAWLFAVCLPLLQMIIMGPALLLATPGVEDPRRVRLEWAAILTASLAISTSPGSYLFMLLILPVCCMLEALLHERRHLFAWGVLGLYTAAGILSGTNDDVEGWKALLMTPRLHILLLLCVVAYVLLMQRRPEGAKKTLRWDRLAWAAVLGIIVVMNINGGLRRQCGLYDDYQWRVQPPEDALMMVHPAIQGDSLHFISLFGTGYHSGVRTAGTIQLSSDSADDVLAVTASDSERWVERVGRESTLVSDDAGRAEIEQAESPVASSDGRWLAYLREDHARGRIMLRALDHRGSEDKLLTPASLNAYEMSFRPDGVLIFSAANTGAPGLFTVNRDGTIGSLGIESARYPAVSPDGHWLAYSQLERGNWNLWLRELTDGQTRRLTRAACNATEPAWASDSKTLYYASDCGRAMWFSVICKRQVVP